MPKQTNEHSYAASSQLGKQDAKLPKENRKPVPISMTPSFHAYYKTKAAERGLTLSECVRQGLAAVLGAYKGNPEAYKGGQN